MRRWRWPLTCRLEGQSVGNLLIIRSDAHQTTTMNTAGLRLCTVSLQPITGWGCVQHWAQPWDVSPPEHCCPAKLYFCNVSGNLIQGSITAVWSECLLVCCCLLHQIARVGQWACFREELHRALLIITHVAPSNSLPSVGGCPQCENTNKNQSEWMNRCWTRGLSVWKLTSRMSVDCWL